MKLYDISMVIREDMPVYKNYESKKPRFEVASNHEENGHFETNIHMNLHTGTHIDFNLHMIKDGSTSSDIVLSDYITEAKVFDLTHIEDHITKKDIEHLYINKGDFVLFKTKNSFDTVFNPNFIYVSEDAAIFLANQNVKGVGIDALGIERNQPGHKTHKVLMAKDIIILEGIVLKDITPDEYTLIALPLRLENRDASMVRAVLIGK